MLSSTPGRAQTSLATRLLPSNMNEDQDYGFAVALDQDVAVVGAFRDEDLTPLETGAAYVFRYNGTDWIEETRLTAATPGGLNWFGWDVAISGNAILASERHGDQLATNTGNAYLYRYTAGQWVEEHVFLPSRTGLEDYGYAVDIDGDVAAIGAPNADEGVADEGVVYVYRKNGATWNEETLLTGSDLSVQSLFGSAISIDGDRILVSAFNANDSTSGQAGKLYIFDYDGSQWNESAVLQSSSSNNIANLGVSVDLEGDWAVGGAPLDDDIRGGAGAALVYHFDGSDWNFHSKLYASDGVGFFLFGSAVSLSGNRLLVTADNWAPPGEGSTGKVYVFEYDDQQDTWTETTGLVADGVSQGSFFGHAAEMQGEVMLVGAPEFSGTFDDSGAAYIYGEPSVITTIDTALPASSFELSAPYPNPFDRNASFVITSPSDQPVIASLYDALGRKVKTLFEGRLQGPSSTNFDITAGDLPDGMYWIHVRTAHNTFTRSIVLIR